MRAAVVVMILAASPGPALADELQRPPAESKPAPSSGWGWAVESASKAWARAPSRGDLSTAIANGGSVAVDAGTKAATEAWEHAPSRADAADFATAQGTRILASGKNAAAGVASFARSSATYTMGRWEAFPSHRQIEDAALAGIVKMPTILGARYVCMALAAPTGPMSPAVSLTCIFVEPMITKYFARSTLQALGRPVDEELLDGIDVLSSNFMTHGAVKLIPNSRAFAVAVRRLSKSEPRLRALDGVVATVSALVSASPAIAANQPGQAQAVLAIPTNHEAPAPSPTDLDKP